MCRKKLYNFNDCLKSEFDAVILTEQKKIYTGFVPSLLHHAMFPKQSTHFIKKMRPIACNLASLSLSFN